ncbi:alpha/beta-hydrolase [Mycena leptocephala]|nr:alpha/beta-hydrolase [Mycena leptocephala]
MRRFIFSLALIFHAFNGAYSLGGAMEGLEDAMAIQREQLERLGDFLGPMNQPSSTPKRQSSITFSSPGAQQFFVDGTTIPDVPFDAGPSWSGLMPISGDPNETRKLFFWFWPTNNVSNSDDLLFWTNGGPGCSSLEAWSWGQAAPTPNMWSWTNLSHVLWVEQPVGTGFSQGTPNITNDDQLAAELMGFFEQFLRVFPELKGNNLWLSGESVKLFSLSLCDQSNGNCLVRRILYVLGSSHVPYIANWFYEHPGLDLNLKGIWIADPSLSYGVVQQEIPALRFARANQNLFPFNSSFWDELQTISDTCGYTDYLDNFVTYPPAGQLPLPVATNGTFSVTPACRIHSPIQRAVGVLNPVFDVYRVSDTWPNLWSVLGFPRSTQEFVYFNRLQVQDAIHAPHIVWNSCATRSVYLPGGDQSIPSTLSVLPNVIEKSERVVIVHGLADFILVAEGTRIAIQNMTWNGAQGFQTPIEPETFTIKNMGVYGNEHTERGLTYVEFYFSGKFSSSPSISSTNMHL